MLLNLNKSERKTFLALFSQASFLCPLDNNFPEVQPSLLGH